MTEIELRKIGDTLLDYTRKQEGAIGRTLEFVDYHGFQKSRFSEDLLNEMLRPFHCTADDVQVEFIHVTSDLTDEVHYHEGSIAFVYVLGATEGFAEPQDAIAYKDGAWIAMKQGEWWMIPPKTVHGFSVLPGGELYFLSVQTPPIVHGTSDDYHRM